MFSKILLFIYYFYLGYTALLCSQHCLQECSLQSARGWEKDWSYIMNVLLGHKVDASVPAAPGRDFEIKWRTESISKQLWTVCLVVHFYMGEKCLQVRICMDSWAEVNSITPVG